MSERLIEDSYVSGSEVPDTSTNASVLSLSSAEQSAEIQPADSSSGGLTIHRSATTMPTSTVQSPTAPAFRPSTLYAILLHGLHGSDSSTSWHWALFLPFDGSNVDSDTGLSLRGTIWHVNNTNPNGQGRWVYEELTPDALGLSTRLILAARLADLSTLGSPPDVSSALSDVLRGVPVRADAHKSVFNCRSWMLDGIGELDDGGFLSCVSTMALERELIAAAKLATPKFEEDGSYVVITPRSCSDN